MPRYTGLMWEKVAAISAKLQVLANIAILAEISILATVGQTIFNSDCNRTLSTRLVWPPLALVE